ncbi:MAG: protein-L-isoaspartate(D-aspartate) O-methyltransferase [Pseudorhodoplanes sp.]|uniref:protein-L-isoaspartate(D-aspartate) O-methyltransferase n=1 Tax=Pseudorhodoplanes sp. TaxID=1934341 RepID=UPI003D0FE08C
MLSKLPLAVLIVASVVSIARATDCARERAAMVDTIRAYARSGPPVSERVLQAMGEVERRRLIPQQTSCAEAHADRPLPIGRGQTISQPYIVALMTELAAVKPDDVVLEIGTGSGYQAAVLARLARKVCTVEIVAPLGAQAAAALKAQGYDNVEVRIGDGYRGFPECGPFDAIVITAAIGHVPQPLVDQLKIGGHLVVPLGPVTMVQQLSVIEKTAPDKTIARSVIPVRFVPFTGPQGGK